MNRSDAKAQAFDNKRSIAELRSLITSQRGTGGMSRVNKQLTKDHALDIFEAALAGRPDDEVPCGNRIDPYSRLGGLRISRDGLMIQNILRECA